MSVTAYIALGSNVGGRRDYLDRALTALRAQAGITIVRVSTIYETRPVGGPAEQGDYLNAVAELNTDLAAEQLLACLLDIERANGRVRTVQNAPRTLDLDLLFFGDLIRNDPQLTLPHPRLHERLFVLQPLAELVPGLVHPVLKRTIADLLTGLLGIKPMGAAPGRELAGLRALVTGSTSGIGRAIALELGRAGADVIIHGRQRRDRAEEVAAAVQRSGGRSAIIMADLREQAGRNRSPRKHGAPGRGWTSSSTTPVRTR